MSRRRAQPLSHRLGPPVGAVVSRRSILGLLCGTGAAASSWLSACRDEAVSAPSLATDAGVDAAEQVRADAAGEERAAEDARADSPGDLTGEAPSADASLDDGAADAPAAVEAGPEVTPDGHRPGILSVPADDPDVVARALSYQSDVTVQAYLAVPNAVGTFAGLILVHDESGLTEHIRDVARRFAKSGCVALAPDLASRAGGTAAVGPARIAAVLAALKPEQLLADLSAGLDTLARQSVVGAGRHGVAGFGFGGTFALRCAAGDPRIRAVVAYYGATPSPADSLKATNAAILGQYGADDGPIVATISELERVLTDAGKTFDKHLYVGAGHGFNDDSGPGYQEAAAVSAWALTVRWFDRNLG